MACPNINSPEWKALVNKIGVFNAFKEFVKNNEQIPNAIDYPETFKGVNATLKVVGALQQIKRPSYPSNQIQGFYNDLIKLGTPKSQIELLKQHIENKGIKEINTNELAISLLSEMSYTIEINTAKARKDAAASNFNDEGFRGNDGFYYTSQYEENGYSYFKYDVGGNQFSITEKDFNLAKNESELVQNSSYYSNLTVPGGTNYTENEIATPAITPSIKGHAQFSTEKGIGWFRSDDKHAFTGFLEDLIASGTIKKVPCG